VIHVRSHAGGILAGSCPVWDDLGPHPTEAEVAERSKNATGPSIPDVKLEAVDDLECERHVLEWFMLDAITEPCLWHHWWW
jgi:hypothetical protein